MIDVIQTHIDKDYCIKVSGNTDKDICVITMPKNICIDVPELTSIYESMNGVLSIYRNKQKFLSKECPNYAIRASVWAHVIKLAIIRNIDAIPVVTKSPSGETINVYENFNTFHPINDVLREPDLHADVELEILLMNTISDAVKGKINSIPESVLEGFTVADEIFKGE